MKKKYLFIAAIFFSIALAHAGTPFTRQSTGYDWNKASTDCRHEYAQLMADANKGLAPNITASVIYDSLQSFYESDDPQILSQPIVQMVALTVTAVAKGQ